MSKMIHDQPSAAVPASRDRRNFLIAGAGLALAATTLGRSGAVMAKPAGQDTPNAPSEAAPVRKETLTQHELLAQRAFRQCWQQHQSRAYPEGLRSHTFLTQRHRFAFVGTRHSSRA